MCVNLEMKQMCLWATYYEVDCMRFRSDFYPTGYEDTRAGFFANT